MDFSFTSQQEAWRKEVREFLRENPEGSFTLQKGDDGYGLGGWSYEFGQLLGSKGWLTLAWPEEWGGQGRPWMDVFILYEELAYARSPWRSVSMSSSMANAILREGSDDMKREFLPGIATGKTTFWLALSEPDAGSDLLSLKTTAIEEDDCFVINGQKVWSTFAHLADYGELLVKTEADPGVPRHRSLSVFILDKKLPGITISPLTNLLGEPYHTEVFMDNVRIQKKYLLGRKNEGLAQMLKALEFDRFWARFVKPPFCRRVLEDLVAYVKNTKRDGIILADDPIIRHKLAESAVEVETCSEIFWHAAWMIDRGLPLSYEASVGKVLADEMGQRLFKKGTQIMGQYSQLGEDSRWAPLRGQLQQWHFRSIGHTLAGGTSEIIRNTLATTGLGLPRK